MANKKGLKQKNYDRLRELKLKHPADLSPEEEKEMNKLDSILEKHGMNN
jgi:hypothetical protein